MIYKVLKTVCERGIKNGMHKTFSSHITCKSLQTKPDNVKIKNVNGEAVICTTINLPPTSNYDAFDEVEIIPSLIKMVEKIKNGRDKNKEIKKWVKEWGLLKGSLMKIEFGQYEKGQSIDSFWKEAEKLYDLWNLYKYTINRELEFLKEYVQKNQIIDTDFIYNDETDSFILLPEFDVKPVISRFFLSTSEKLVAYQSICMTYILRQIQEHISKGILTYDQLKRDSYQGKDYFKVTPIISFGDLLDALYMQLFILMTENEKKICPICDHPFTPERKDKKYCSETCYLTAKSRRYRARKNAAM